MKKFAVIFMAFVLVLSLAACGSENEATSDSSTDETTAQAEENTASDEVSLVAKCDDCTITVPELETFFDGYQGATVKYNNPEPNDTVYVNLYKDDPNLEVNVSVRQLNLSSVETNDAKGYAEYFNSNSKYNYEPVEIAGFSGYLATDFLSSSITTDNYYLIDYPLSDGSSVVINLWVTQRYYEDTSEMTPIAEAFLKNIEVVPNNE